MPAYGGIREGVASVAGGFATEAMNGERAR